MKRALVAAAAVLALAAPVGVGAQVPDYSNPPPQTVSITADGERMANLLGLTVTNAIGETCDGRSEPFDSGLDAEYACWLKLGLEDAYAHR